FLPHGVIRRVGGWHRSDREFQLAAPVKRTRRQGPPGGRAQWAASKRAAGGTLSPATLAIASTPLALISSTALTGCANPHAWVSTFATSGNRYAASGLIAVARLSQGISPKHCASPARGWRAFAECLITARPSPRRGTRANDNRPVSCFAAKRCLCS